MEFNHHASVPLGYFCNTRDNEKFLLFCCGFVVTLADFAAAMGQNEDTPIAGFADWWYITMLLFNYFQFIFSYAQFLCWFESLFWLFPFLVVELSVLLIKLCLFIVCIPSCWLKSSRWCVPFIVRNWLPGLWVLNARDVKQVQRKKILGCNLQLVIQSTKTALLMIGSGVSYTI